MKKRLLSILLTLCMVLCLVPITVFAAGGAKAILPGTSARSILKIDQSRLSFAGHEWWVIGQKTDESNNAPIITLLAVNNDFGDVPFRTGSAVPFENSSRYSEDNGYYANNPSDMSQWRKPNEYAGSTLQQKMVSLAEAIPEKEQAAIRPKDITKGITGQEVNAQKLWAFSQEDSIYLYRNSCKYAAKWWTRSSNEVYGYGSWTIHPDGRSGSALNVDYDAAVRPAMELDLSSVLFISAAEHGKVADLTTPIAEYAGAEWKLTLHDSDRDDFTAKTVLVNGSVLEVEYKNAKVGDNEYISAVIKDADGSISHYTRVVQLDGTTNGTRGRAAIDLTGIDLTGKTLCVFNEQFNGDHKTDYAGALREVKLTDEIDEQFSLTPGGRYYFDLSTMNIPGTANGDLPDSTLHYVPFTYAGTVDAYKLTSAMATTDGYAEQNKYAHSLFVADYAVTHTLSWDDLNTKGLIFGKNYASGGVDYTMRAPSAGSQSNNNGKDDSSTRGIPKSNEWDAILDKANQDWKDNTSGYIKNWSRKYSFGQDNHADASIRAVRGHDSARYWRSYYASYFLSFVGFRPVLEVLNPDELGADALKAVTLDLGGGKLGGSTDAIQIIVKNGSTFTAPMSGGLTRPDGNTGSYFMWLGSNGKLYAPGASVPADVTKLTAQFALSEQFSLTPGGTYYFDLSGANIPGTANGSLPDTTLHYVPFTYAGTIEAYKLTSAMATTEEYAQREKYPHSLFIADYAVTHTISWDDLNTKSLIFGKNYASGGVDYTLRAPSVGSNSTGSGDSQRGVPQSNEWDTMLNKNSGYIQNWNEMYSWGQDAYSTSFRAVRGYNSARNWDGNNVTGSSPDVGFRPVLEVLNPDTLGSDGLKVVTLDLNGGKLGGSSDAIHIIVKNGSEFTAPASDGLNRPAGDTGSYFMWLGSNGKLYAPGDSVPTDVTKLTAQFALSEQFSLAPGGRYYFDLSAMNIPGTVNTGNIFGVTSLPDTTLHYVPFTYAGTVNAYKLTTEMATTEEYAQKNKYPHSLFVADYAVTNDVSWDALNTADLIFGKDYASGGVDYTLRAPSVGSNSTGSGDSQRGVPQSNEWDTMLNKNSGYIQNWNTMYSWGQDAYSTSYRAVRGYYSARYWYDHTATYSGSDVGFRPVLEVLNSDTLGSGGLKVVTLDLGGGKLGVSSDAIQIIVKNGSEFTAPASDGLTRPDGNTGSYFMWLDGNGKSYEPGDSVPADVTELTVQWTAPTYTVTLHANGGTINNGNVTSYTYGVGATLPTADDMTYTGHTFKGWYDNESLTGSPVTAIGNTETGNKEYWAKWEINQYTITFDTAGGSAIAPITQDYGTPITAPADPTREGYTFAGWDKAIPATMPAENLTITAQWTINQYTITFDTAGGSEIAPITQDYGTPITAPADPTREGYTFAGWDKAIPATMPAENMTVTAQWRVNRYTITYDLDRGTADDNPTGYTVETETFTLKNPTRPGYIFSGWSGTGLTGEDNLTVTIPKGSTGNRSYTAHWRYNGGYRYYTIKATAGAGGSISPNGNVSVREGSDRTFTITPDKGYAVSNVKIDGKSIGAVRSYTFENVRHAHTIEVSFMKAGGNPQTGVFVDVATGSYYEDAVDWAVESGITTGVNANRFDPNGACTRAQAVTFLWRAAGSPAPRSRTMPFTDVPAGSYYYDAVLWAVENGITKGTSDTRFSPDDTCTRAQIVAFLWRSEKSPAAGSRNPFADVKSTAYYADAVLWAVREDITKGTTSTTFSPDADCTRAQIVTFLWRCKK